MERLLVDQIIACWLQLKQAEMAAGSDQLTSLMQRRFFDQRLERAQRRHFGAMKLLAQLRRLPVSALMPAGARERPVGLGAPGLRALKHAPGFASCQSLQARRAGAAT